MLVETEDIVKQSSDCIEREFEWINIFFSQLFDYCCWVAAMPGPPDTSNMTRALHNTIYTKYNSEQGPSMGANQGPELEQVSQSEKSLMASAELREGQSAPFPTNTK